LGLNSAKRQNKGNNDGNSSEEESDDSGLFEEPKLSGDKEEETQKEAESESAPTKPIQGESEQGQPGAK